MAPSNFRSHCLRDRIVSTPNTTLVGAPPGFDKKELLEAIAEAWPKPEQIQFFDSWDHSEDPTSAARAIAVSASDQLIMVADAQEADATLLLKALERHCRGQPSSKIIISYDTACKMSLNGFAVSNGCDVIDATSLLLSADDQQTLLASIGWKSDRDKVEHLAKGWPVALRLLVAQVQKSSERYLDHDDSELLCDSGLQDFVLQRIMPVLSEPERAALIKASLLDDGERDILSGIGRSEAQMIALSQRLSGLIERTPNGFIINPVLKHCAIAYEALNDPERHQATVVELADQCSRKGHLSQAARLAARAGAPERIADYAIAHYGLAIWLTAGYPALKAMVGYAGDDVVQSSPLLRMFECIIDLKSSRLRQAEGKLAALMNDPEIAKAYPDQIEVTRTTLMVYGCTFMRANEAEGLSRLIEQSVGKSAWRTYLATLGCVARSQQGRFDEALAFVDQARRHAGDGGLAYNLMFLHMHQAGIEIAKGEIARARATLKQAQKELVSLFPDDVSAGTVIAALTAATDYETGKLANARNTLKRSKVLEPDAEAWFDIYFTAYDALARTYVKQRPLSEVLELLKEEGARLAERDLPRVAELVEAIAYNVACGAMLLQDAKIGQDLAFDVLNSDEKETWQEQEVFTLARAHNLHLQNNNSAAIKLLHAASEKALGKGLVRSGLRLDLLRFVILHKQGSITAASDVLQGCLALAAKTGMVQVFRDYTAPFIKHYRPLLEQGQDLSPEEQDVLAPMRPANDDGQSGEVAHALSERELEILVALAGGGTDKELARKFGISDNGVRYHLRSIFRKLDVKDRLSAVVTAQKQGLTRSS